MVLIRRISKNFCFSTTCCYGNQEQRDIVLKTSVTSYSRSKADIITNKVPKEVAWNGVCNDEKVCLKEGPLLE